MTKRFKILIDHTENEWRFVSIADINGSPGEVIGKIIKKIELGDGFYELIVKFEDEH